MSKIFISYSRQSEAMARSLASDIESLGHVVWFDQELSGGQAWWNQILARVRDCDVFVLLLDPKSLDSTACQREFGYADALGKPLLPVLVAEGVSTNLLPPELSRIQFIDYRKQDRHTAFGLARALGGMPPAKPLPDPLPPPPDVPVSYLGGLARRVDISSILSYEEQSALVLDLRKGLRDPATADDSRTLLSRLRNRRDLFAAIADEIDDVLGSQRPAPAVRARAAVAEPTPVPVAERLPVAEPLPKVEAAQATDSGAAHKAPPAVAPRGTLRALLIGAAIGAIVGGVAVYSDSPREWSIGAVLDGIAGACIGAITGTHRKVILIAMAGLIVGLILWQLAASRFVMALVFGAPMGAIVGAIAGAIARKRGWT